MRLDTNCKATLMWMAQHHNYHLKNRCLEQAITWAKVNHDLCRHMAQLDHYDHYDLDTSLNTEPSMFLGLMVSDIPIMPIDGYLFYIMLENYQLGV